MTRGTTQRSCLNIQRLPRRLAAFGGGLLAMTLCVTFYFCLLTFNFPRSTSANELRVVSLAPSLTETLFALGLDETQIVGITDYCDYPEGVSKIPRVGSLITVNIEHLVSLEPDYVFAVGHENSPLNYRLKKVGLNVVVIDPLNVQDTLDAILKVGEILDRQENAKKVVEGMKLRLSRMAEKVKTIKTKKRVYVEIWDDPIISCGKGSLVDEIISRAGCVNITAAIESMYPTISQEVVVKEDPEIIILGYMSRDQEKAVNAVLSRFGWKDIKAVKNKAVICSIEPNLFLRPGPRIIDGIEKIYTKVYED